VNLANRLVLAASVFGGILLVWLYLWAVARRGNVSLKPLKPWLLGVCLVFGPLYFVIDFETRYRIWRAVFGAIFWGCWIILQSIDHWYRFEALWPPNAKWYLRWKAAGFSIPRNVRIQVQDLDKVSPWYIEKLGLRKLAATPQSQIDLATYRFKEGGNSVVLSANGNSQTHKMPILFAKKIEKIKDVLCERGVEVGTIERDRQGIRYFQIHDPEGNVIEVVEDR
jgi:predicted enzyme related to lactoylglutathione lyase